MTEENASPSGDAQEQTEVPPAELLPSGEATPPVAEPQLLQPIEWGRQLGKVRRANVWFGEGPRGEDKSPDYLAAEHLHGWIEAELRGRPARARKLTISRQDFESAIEAAMTAAKDGTYTPHHAALAFHLRGDA